MEGDPPALMEVSLAMIAARGQAMALLPPDDVSWSNGSARELRRPHGSQSTRETRPSRAIS